jgi:hypothetical protein
VWTELRNFLSLSLPLPLPLPLFPHIHTSMHIHTFASIPLSALINVYWKPWICNDTSVRPAPYIYSNLFFCICESFSLHWRPSSLAFSLFTYLLNPSTPMAALPTLRGSHLLRPHGLPRHLRGYLTTLSLAPCFFKICLFLMWELCSVRHQKD